MPVFTPLNIIWQGREMFFTCIIFIGNSMKVKLKKTMQLKLFCSWFPDHFTYVLNENFVITVQEGYKRFGRTSFRQFLVLFEFKLSDFWRDVFVWKQDEHAAEVHSSTLRPGQDGCNKGLFSFCIISQLFVYIIFSFWKLMCKRKND